MLTTFLLAAAFAQPAPKPPAVDGPKAVITLRDGKPIPSKVDANKTLFLSAKKSTKDAECICKWLVFPPNLVANPDNWGKYEGGTEFVLNVGPTEQAIMIGATVAAGKQVDVVMVTVIVGKGPRPPPVPPGPDPPIPPKPPTPKPPTPASGLKVLIVRETGDATSISPAFAQVVRKYLDEKATKAGWRIWDDDQEFAGSEPAILKEMFDKSKPFQSLPALIVKNDGSEKATAMPLPKTVEALMSELRKWGG